MPNLVQNPGFEAGLAGWTATNVTPADVNPFEGTAAARLGPGIASLFQDIPIDGYKRLSFLLSFAVEAPLSFNPGDLTVQVQWLDATGTVIGIGLSLFIPSATTGTQFFWLTYVDATENAPINAKTARIIFSKAQGSGRDVLDVDKVVLLRV
ncbi:hypothetical protein [Calderihabitans maritimus]|nr:hypothetical protein [Calderihabitans maritimus]